MLRRELWSRGRLGVLGLWLPIRRGGRSLSLVVIGELMRCCGSVEEMLIVVARFHYMFSFLGLPWQDIAIKEKSSL